MTFSVLGTDIFGQPITLNQSERRQGTYIIGATGTGKSTLIENLIMQDIDQHIGVGVLAAGDTSTAASFPQRNYTIASGSAWSRLIEVQGFGQRYVDAHGTTLGTVNISANAISRFITFSVPTESLGTPGSGWGFTVVLTGQDGFSPDQTRGFAAIPQPFLFGVCAPGGTSPICSVDPATVPKAMDVLTPPGVSQSVELDPTLGPVILQDVTIP